MDFTISPRTEVFRRRIERFVEDHILPLEADRSAYDAHENIRPEVLDTLRARARAEGLWCLQLAPETGGQGLGKVGMAVCYEAMNRSIFGPVVFNSAAPDDGNMMVLEKVATPHPERALARAHRRRKSALRLRDDRAASWLRLRPLDDADQGHPQGRSLHHRGRKWFITGAEDAEHFILMARTSDDPRKGLSAFLFDRSAPGWRIERRIPIMGPEEHGGHCELVFEGLEIPVSDLLMNEVTG